MKRITLSQQINIGSLTLHEGQDVYLLEDTTQSKEFKQWFGNSKVVDKSGNPLVVYHGTSETFDSFDLSKSGTNYNEGEGGIFFTDKESSAKNYASLHSGGERDGNVLEVFLKIENPYVDRAEDYWDAVDKFDRNAWTILRELPFNNQDGVIITSPRGSLYVVLSPDQIKSVNATQFNPNSDNIFEHTTTGGQEVYLQESGNGATYKGKPFWIGVADALDGEILGVYDFDTAESYDFHHSFYVPGNLQDKLDNGEAFMFIVENGKVWDIWRDTIKDPAVLRRIKQQIVLTMREASDRKLTESTIRKGGKTKVVGFHGSDEKILAFDTKMNKYGSDYGSGAYFAGTIELAKQYGQIIHQVELTFNNPLVIQNGSDMNRIWDSLIDEKEDGSVPKEYNMQDYIKSKGCDSLIVEDPTRKGEGAYYVAYDPKQIKILKTFPVEFQT
jgi:hypothetical protein